MSAKCGVCRRSSFMADNGGRIPDGEMCSECATAASGEGITGNMRPLLWAAKRAWEFSDAITDATSFAHRPGDPGHSRTPRTARRRR